MLSKIQKQLMEHTISGPDRNRFGTDIKGKAGQEFEKLVEMGLATKEFPPAWMRDEVIYRLTQKGKNLIVKFNQGEIMIRRFKIIEAEVGSFTTEFTIRDLDHQNGKNKMSVQSFFHHLGYLVGKDLEDIEGLEFSVELEKGKQQGYDPLELCGQTIGL